MKIYSDLTPAQKEAVTHASGPCLVVAGAGTGKTTVITRRIAQLIEKGTAPERIVALTFTEKAAQEMEERVDQLVPYGATGAIISTFHSFSADLVKRNAFLLGLDPEARVVSTAEELSFLHQHLADLPTKQYKPSHNSREFLRNLSQFISKAKDECLTPEQIKAQALKEKKAATDLASQEQAELLLELSELYATAQQLFQDASLLTYADLVFQAVRLLRDFPSVQAAEEKLIEHLLIDEFQDTNFGQNEIARLLRLHNQNIMAVGDDDQAIYSFRGANLSNILGFTTTFKKCRVITLTDNFRSNQPILGLAYRLIQANNPNRLEVQEKINKKLEAQHERGNAPVYTHYRQGALEYRGMVEQIQALLTEYAAEDIAILTRSKQQLNPLETALKGAGIAYQLHNERGFYQQTVIRTAHAYLRFLINPDDNLNLFYLLSQVPFSVGERVLQPYTKEARYRHDSLWEYLNQLQPKDLEGPLEYLKKKLLQSIQEKPSLILADFLQSSRLYRQLEESPVEAEALATLHQEILTYEQIAPEATLASYMQHLDALLATNEEISLNQELTGLAQGIQLMTIHRSKGLEFPVVFLPMWVEGRFPTRFYRDPLPFPYTLCQSQPPDRESNLQEERRLAYVAITRARERLYISSSEQYEERKLKSRPSPFLAEMGLEGKADAGILTSPKIDRKEPAPLTLKRFSPSALETYLDCPRKFYYQSVLQVKVPSSHFSNFGISIHQVLREWYEMQRQGKTPDLVTLYKKAWIRGGYESKAMERQRYQEGLLALQKWLQQTEPATPTQLEQSVKLNLKNGCLISGKIDRLDRLESGSLKLIDYKTSERPLSEKELPVNLPLNLYVLALQQKGYPVEQVELDYVMIGEKRTIPVAGLDLAGTTSQVENIILDINRDLADDTFTALPDKFKCQYCDYREICPFRYR